MSFIKEQKIIARLEAAPSIKAVGIRVSTQGFNQRFDGSASHFFRVLKNGLNSIERVSNRAYFRNLSGCYFSLESSTEFEMIIFYDESRSELSHHQVEARIKKLLGEGIEIEFGNLETFALRIQKMITTQRKTQMFGDFYFNQN